MIKLAKKISFHSLLISFIVFSPSLQAQETSQIQMDNTIIKTYNTLCNDKQFDHIPSVDTNYKPGIDANGKSVTPADIGTDFGGNIYPLYIPLEIDILERLDINVPPGVKMDPEIAGVMVYDSGRVTYNGKDISKNLVTFCNETVINDQDNPAATIEMPPAQNNHQNTIETNETSETISGEFH